MTSFVRDWLLPRQAAGEDINLLADGSTTLC
jgi:hypothetical protein